MSDLIDKTAALKIAQDIGYLDYPDSVAYAVSDALAALPTDPRVAKLVEALAGLVACQGDDPCRYDHHGYCQEHYIEAECSVAKARAALAAWETDHE
jgi:hypothetical protein